MRKRARGVTLVELLVVLVLIGVTASVVGLALGSAKRPSRTSFRGDVAAARDSAIQASRPFTEQIRGSDGRIGGDREITALPDGRVIADSATNINRLSGVSDDVR